MQALEAQLGPREASFHPVRVSTQGLLPVSLSVISTVEL